MSGIHLAPPPALSIGCQLQSRLEKSRVMKTVFFFCCAVLCCVKIIALGGQMRHDGSRGQHSNYYATNSNKCSRSGRGEEWVTVDSTHTERKCACAKGMQLARQRQMRVGHTLTPRNSAVIYVTALTPANK